MPYSKTKGWYSERKLPEWTQIVDNFHKSCQNAWDLLESEAKNAKNGQNTVIVDKNGLKNDKLATATAIHDYIDAYKAPVSIPNPNEAFRRKKEDNSPLLGRIDGFDIYGEE